MHALVAANGKDRHDVRMMKRRGDLGLDLKPGELPGVGPWHHGKDFQGDLSPERHLDGLVHHAHSAAADLADATETRRGCTGR